VVDTTDEIFLSYHHNDRELAGKIKLLLERKGFAAFLAHEDVDPSVEWRAAIQLHLTSCTAMIAIVTKDFEKSSFTNQEVGIAMANDKKVIPLVFGVKLRDLPGFLEARQAVPGSRHRLSRSLDRAVRPFARLPSLESGLLDRMTLGLFLFSITCLIALSSAVLWVFLGPQVFPWGPFAGLVLGGVIAFEKYYKGSIDVMRAIDWCRRNIPLILVGAGCFVPASFAFTYSLSLYPKWSLLRFDTYLDSAPFVASEAFVALVFGAFMLYHPTTSVRRMRHGALTWMRAHYKSFRIYSYAVILIVLAVSTAPIDTTLVLGTPRVGLIESRYVSDGLIHIVYGADYALEAYAVNERTLHILLPLVLLVDRVYYPLMSNSTEECKIIRESALTASLVKDQAGRLLGLWMLMDRTTSSTVLVTVSYYNELNVSSVATITFQKEKALRNFDNGTWQMQQTFQIVNISPHTLRIGPLYLYHSTNQFEVTKNITDGFADVSYTEQGHWLYFNGDLDPRGSMVLTVTYNRPGSL
jgi:hypothetical protein